MWFLINTGDGKKILECDALNMEIVDKCIKELKKEGLKDLIKQEMVGGIMVWAIKDNRGYRLETLPITNDREFIEEYTYDCYRNQLRLDLDSFLDGMKERGIYCRFINLDHEELYL